MNQGRGGDVRTDQVESLLVANELPYLSLYDSRKPIMVSIRRCETVIPVYFPLTTMFGAEPPDYCQAARFSEVR